MKKEIAQDITGLNLSEKKISWKDLINKYIKEKKIKFKNKPLIISICQNKGGVGKTTSTINLGYLFSLIGKTLLIDMDAQANLSQSFNIYPSGEDFTLKDFLDNPDKNIVRNIDENLDILPNRNSFDLWKKSKGSETRSYKLLKKALRDIKNYYDFILIDCPPSLDITFDMAITSSEFALIVMDGEPFALENIENIISELKKINDEDSLDLKILGILFNKYQETNLKSQVFDLAAQKYEVFENKIRATTHIAESQAVKQPIFKYKESSNGSIDFFKVWVELVSKLR